MDIDQDNDGHLAEETLSALDGLANEVDDTSETDALADGVSGEMQTVAQQKADAQAKLNKALMSAAGTVAMLEKGLQKKWEYIELEDDQKAELIGALAPVFAKHDVGMPAWLEPYKEEFMAACALGGLMFGVYQQVEKHEKQAAAEQSNDKGKAPAAATREVQKPATVSAQSETLGGEMTSGSIIDLGRRMQ